MKIINNSNEVLAFSGIKAIKPNEIIEITESEYNLIKYNDFVSIYENSDSQNSEVKDINNYEDKKTYKKNKKIKL